MVLGLHPGAVLISTIDSALTAKVIDSHSIEFQGRTMSLTGAALEILRSKGKNPVSARGPAFWTHNGVKLTEL
jgi:hypothetical protein